MSTLEVVENSDSLSKLVQIRAAQFGIRLAWSGKAIEDIDTLCLEYWTRKNFNECLWNNGLRDLMLMPEFKTMPESLQAKIASIVLKARAHFELKAAQRVNPKSVPGGSAA
jgi:hypothetical protein